MGREQGITDLHKGLGSLLLPGLCLFWVSVGFPRSWLSTFLKWFSGLAPDFVDVFAEMSRDCSFNSL